MTDQPLLHAMAALDAGDSATASELARCALQRAQAGADAHAEARALACLAHCDRQVSRLRRAHDGSQRAAHLFRQLGDAAAEAMALSTLAHTAVSLGRTEEAIEAALLSVKLGESLPVGRHLALAYNYLGTAYFWSRSYDQAEANFERSAAIARSLVTPLCPLQPQANLAYLEAYRWVTMRFLDGARPDARQMSTRLADCTASIARHGFEGLADGIQVTSRAMHHLLSALCSCWAGDRRHADAELQEGAQWSSRYSVPTWLHAVQEWVKAELTWADGDWAGAQRYLTAMTQIAASVEHEQLACLGHVLASTLYDAMGQPAPALNELRRLRRREDQIRIESLESRARVVAWQLDIRQAEHHLRALEASSQHMARLSLEDPLTGLANRRCLVMQVDKCLRANAADGEPLSLAFIDIDHFKRVNDRHSHRVGDLVLKRLATILTTSVREQDLPARLAGDEFVIVFQRTESDVAAQVCARIQEAIAGFDWESLSAGLQVRVSLGIEPALPGDTVEALLHRSDIRMYGAKPAPTPTPMT